MKFFCESLREHAMKIINLKRKNELINKRVAKKSEKSKNLLYKINI